MNVKDSELKKLIAITKLIYQKTPFPFRWPFSPIKLIYRLIYRLAQKLRVNTWIISGNDPLTKQPLTIIYAGHDKNKNYMAKLAFDSSYNEHHMGKTWLWNLTKMTNNHKSDCSLMVLEVDRVSRRLVNNKKAFFIPCWIGGILDLSVDIPSLIRTQNTLRSVVSKIRKNNLEFELTKDQHHFENFYNNMYLPYITSAYENKAHLMTYDEMKKKSQNCELLLIKKEKKYIAGILIDYESLNNVPKLWSLGVKDGNPDYVKAGVIGASTYFSFKYLKEQGYKGVHFGASRPFLNDGVLRYKKKWGLQIVDSTEKGFLITPLSSSIGTKGFLLKNPFIYFDQDELTGAIFVESNQLVSVKDFERLYKDYYMKGLSKLVVYVFGDSTRGMEEIVPAEFSGRLSIRSAAMLF